MVRDAPRSKFTQATYTCLRDALLTVRVRDLILRSIAERCVSKDDAIEAEIALVLLSQKAAVSGV
jgi:hypothetical protein